MFLELLENMQKLLKPTLINGFRERTSANPIFWGNVIASKVILL